MLGMHLSLCNPLVDTAFNAGIKGLETYQIFIRNNRSSKQRLFPIDEIQRFNEYNENIGINDIVVHAAYTMNPCTDNEEKRSTYISRVLEDLSLCDSFTARTYYVIHPGSAVDLSNSRAMSNLISFMNEISCFTNKTIICPEYMSGAGSQMLCNVDECLYLMSATPANVKLCLDTCHMFTSYSDINYAFARLLDESAVMHLNNSAYAKFTHKDRHAPIYSGCINTDALVNLYNAVLCLQPRMPIILETPSATMYDDFKFLKQNEMDYC